MKLDVKRSVIIAVLLAVLGILLVLGLRTPGAPLLGGEGGMEAGNGYDPTSHVPSASEPLTEARTVAPAAPGVTAQLRVFDMTATAGGFEPDRLVVNEGDTISVRMKAGASAFDIVVPDLGLHQTARPGEGEKVLEFQASAAGTYPFACEDECPGGRKLEGEILVKKVGS